MRAFSISFAALGILLLAACGNSSASAVLRFSGIPDSDKSKLDANAAILQSYLGKELGMDVKFVEAADYGAARNGVVNNKLDLAWLGGVTSVQAENLSKGDVTFVACRASDLKFKSYFIASKEAIDAGRLKVVKKLEDLKPMLKDCTFSFGDKSSTSGHIMPRYFMTQAGIDLEKGIKGGPKFQASGGHSATLRAVASGAVDCGALNYKTYEAADAATKSQAVVIYVTPPYVDYCMVAHNRLGEKTIARIRSVFTELSPDNPAQKKVLDAFQAERFVAADPKEWDGIRAVLKTLEVE